MFLGSLLVVFRESTVIPIITKSLSMSELGRVTVTNLGKLFYTIWLIFSQSNSTMTRAGIETRDPEHSGMLIISLRHRFFKFFFKFKSFNSKIKILPWIPFADCFDVI